MKSACKLTLAIVVGVVMMSAGQSRAAITPGDGWGQINRDMRYGLYWDQFTNRHYGGYNNAMTWPGGWWDVNLGGVDTERRTFSNYKGLVVGATGVQDPQYPAVTWPYMVGQRDGWNDGERPPAYPTVAPDPLITAEQAQTLFKGRTLIRTFRQAWPVVTTDGVENPHLAGDHWDETNVTATWPQLGADSSDVPWQADRIDPDAPADLTFETHSWSRMGISTQRKVYQFADRNNDDYMFWHWRIVNTGIWGLMGNDLVDSEGGTHGTVNGVIWGQHSQWDRASAGANRTNSAGEMANDTIWRYYGADYDGAQTEDMRLIYVIDGDQDESKYNPDHGKQNDIGDPDPNTGHLLSAKTGGLQFLHIDTSPTDRNDDVAQPRTIGWQHYNYLIRTQTAVPAADDGHEAKYNQMLLGYQATPYAYQVGPYQTTPGRGTHPNAAEFASWIKASNDPATSGTYWPGKVLGVDPEVTDCEQQFGIGPFDMAPFDTVNSLQVWGVKGIDEPVAAKVGADWLAGNITDAEKDAIVHSTIDSLFDVMRQAKAVYEAADFGGRYAATRTEFEMSLDAAVDAGLLALSPPAPASFDVLSRASSVKLEWSLNTTTGSDIAGYRIYRALGSTKGDSAFTMIAEVPSSATAWLDADDIQVGFSYYYYLTTFDADGNESTMQTRTWDPAIPTTGPVAINGQPLRFALEQNAPNPFNPTTTIRLSLAEAGETQLDIYNMTGQLVRTLVNGNMSAGQHEVVWDGTDAVGNAIGSGVFIYRLTSGDNVQVRRMVLIR